MRRDDPRHGTRNGYINLGCRCRKCRAAATDAIREYRHRTGRCKPREQFVAEVHAAAEARDNHGTETRYRFGCRCDQCRKAMNAERARRRRTPNVKVHNYSGYANGCRCDVCRDDRNRYLRERRAAA